MKKDVVMNHFIRAITMGDEIFEMYAEKAKSNELLSMIRDFRHSFMTQKRDLENILKQKGMVVDEECTFLQKNAIFMEKIKTLVVQNDYDLCIHMIESMHSALIGALKYYAKIDDEIREEFIDIIENTLQNYDDIIGKVKRFALEHTEYHSSLDWNDSKKSNI